MRNGRKRATIFTVMLILASFLFTSGFSFITLSREALKTENAEGSSTLPFSDIKGISAEAAIMEMYARGVIKGENNETFRPKQPVTNLEAIIVIDRLLGYRPSEEDIKSNIYLQETFGIPRWAVGYIGWALNNDLLVYEELPKISMQEPLIKQDAAVFAVRALDLTKEAKKRKDSELTFNDTNDLSPEMKGYISVAADQGVLKGFTDGSFQPNGPVSRGEMAVILSNISDVLQPVAENQAVGFIKEIDAESRSITLSGIAAMEFKLILPENYVCYLDLKPTTLDTLEKGDYVSVISKEGGLTVVMAKTKGSDKGINIPFENISPGQAPAEIEQWIEANKNAEKYLAKIFENNLYILVCRGEKKTAGYTANITRISGIKDENALEYTITTDLSDPDPDALVSQVIDYPYDLVRIDYPGELLSTLCFVDKKNQKIAEFINKK